jgi:hypothetical protein
VYAKEVPTVTFRHILGIVGIAGCIFSTHLCAQEQWMLLSHESGCGSLRLLVKMERLPHAPSSPEEFAEMMRARGHQVSVGLPDGFPAEMAGRAVMVKYADNRAPVFLRSDLCGR